MGVDNFAITSRITQKSLSLRARGDPALARTQMRPALGCNVEEPWNLCEPQDQAKPPTNNNTRATNPRSSARIDLLGINPGCTLCSGTQPMVAHVTSVTGTTTLHCSP